MKSFMLTSKAYEGRYMELVCEQTPSVEDNSSEIKWTLTVKGGEVSWYSTGPTTLTIGGQQVYYCKRKAYTTKTFPAAKGSVSGTLTVPHGEDGSCSLEVSLTTAIYTATLSTVSESWALDTIHRASQIRASDANIGSCATVVIGRYSGEFTHTVSYRFGALTGWLDGLGDPVAEPVRHGETTLNFLLPESFYGEIPNSPRDNCVLTCTTYYGDTVIGETNCSFWAAADPVLCSPQVVAAVEPVDELTLSLTDGRLIPGISTAYCSVAASAQKGASLVSVTAGGVEVTEGMAELPGWALPTVPVVVTDSRGYSTLLELVCSYVNYTELTNLSEAARPEPTADSAILTLRGTAFFGSFGAAENALVATVEFDGRLLTVPLDSSEEGSYEATVLLENLSYTRSYPVTVTVADKAMAVTRELTVRKGIPVFDWGERDFRFHVPVELPSLTLSGTSLEEYIRSVIER